LFREAEIRGRMRERARRYGICSRFGLAELDEAVADRLAAKEGRRRLTVSFHATGRELSAANGKCKSRDRKDISPDRRAIATDLTLGTHGFVDCVLDVRIQ